MPIILLIHCLVSLTHKVTRFRKDLPQTHSTANCALCVILFSYSLPMHTILQLHKFPPLRDLGIWQVI